MVRTVISLDSEDKRWLDERAAREKVPMTEIVRRGMRKDESDEKRESNFREVLDALRGTWRHGDGLECQIRIREEWDR